MNKLHNNKMYNWLFLCRDGNYIYGQAPNMPIIVAGIAYVLALVVQDSSLKDFISLIFRLSIITWAVLELAWGINNFRRILGASILIVVSAGILMS